MAALLIVIMLLVPAGAMAAFQTEDRGFTPRSMEPPQNGTVATSPPENLRIAAISHDSIQITWEPPQNGTATGYQINFTTPAGAPTRILANNTLSQNTTYAVTGLQPSTPYSFRVAAWNAGGLSGLSGIESATTGLVSGEIESLNKVNTDKLDVRFVREDPSDDVAVVYVVVPDGFELNCRIHYTFANTQSDLIEPSKRALSPGYSVASFEFRDHGNDIVTLACFHAGEEVGGLRYVLAMKTPPIVQQIEDFSAGEFGTAGFIGALDLITLFGILLSMIAFRKSNPAIGSVIGVSIMGVLVHFGLMSIPGALMGGVAVIVMLAIVSTRKSSHYD